MKVSVLFAMERSVYHQFDCDVWDEQRDARNWPGGNPVVAHPPCRSWGQLSYFSKHPPTEPGLAIWAVLQVIENCGVLEHPFKSKLWRCLDLSGTAAYTIVVDQNWWGHKAQKRTKLLINGCRPRDLPRMPLELGEGSHVVSNDKGQRKTPHKPRRPELSKRLCSATPPAFAEWLIEVARRCAA